MVDEAPRPAEPKEWTKEQWMTYPVSEAPTFSCPNCRKAGVRVTLTSDWDGDDYRSWRILTWVCKRCTLEWAMRDDRVAPDWKERVN